jgi:hypothetical protein
MKRLPVLLALGLVVPALAQDHGVTFSNSSKELRLASYDAKTATHLFQGKVVVTGTVVFQFDMSSPSQANGDVTFAKLIPDASSIRKLPVVISGTFAGPIRYVSLEPADLALKGALGVEEAVRASHGTKPTLSARVKVTIRTFRTGVECEARSYWATIEPTDVVPTQEMVVNAAAPNGC